MTDVILITRAIGFARLARLTCVSARLARVPKTDVICITFIDNVYPVHSFGICICGSTLAA
jgi:hypothetical protein